MFRLSGRILVVLAGLALPVLADDPAGLSAPSAPGGISSAEILNNYETAVERQQQELGDLSMQVDISATLPRLKKEGSFHALRHVTRFGRITYDGVRFLGDKVVKKDVIARYLTAEAEASNNRANGDGNGDVKVVSNGDGKATAKLASLAITQENYKFKYKGMSEHEGRRVHVFQLSPKKKRVGLFKGELWIDPDSNLPVREAGRFVKNPSIFLKKVEFVRDYELRDGLSLPSRILSRIDTRIVGRAELNILFSNVSVQSGAEQAAMVCPMGW
ncbi:MAG TPA: hypothetical protein VLE22_24230 [Bryobacteraceae bacterium]|nr:hypothetical protein [Bryobacteraceae bacterium]